MNNIFLKNNNLTVKISTLGAEIQSVKKSTFGKEIPIYGRVIHRYYFRFAESLQTTSL